MAAADPTEEFAAVVAGPDAAVPLDRAGLLIAAHARPELDVEAELARFDDLAARLPEPTLHGLIALLFRDLGFSGNDVDYYDARNSYLDQVLTRHTGIPITLSVVMMEVGRRAGVPLAGVSMPGHFLVRDKVDPEVFVDAFARGTLLDREGCRRRFRGVHGPDARFDESYLEPVGRRSILARMLANLEGIADRSADRSMLTWVLRLRCALPEAVLDDHRRLAAVLSAGGRIDEAAQALASYAGPGGEEAAAEAARLRARLN
jgi:regulator of sirC expression with transglutaminase-like and TPR domain